MRSTKKLVQLDFDHAAFANLASLVRISEHNLRDLKRIADRHGDGMQHALNQVDVRQIYRKFRSIGTITHKGPTSAFDTLRQARQLAWALTYSENGLPRIVDTRQLSVALRLIEDRFSISALLGVFDTLLQSWNERNAGMLRSFVKMHLANYNGRRKFVHKLKAKIAWYSEKDSATRLALKLTRLRVRLSDVWSYLELPDYMNHYRYFGFVAKAYISIKKPRDSSAITDVVEFVEKHKDDKTSRIILSGVIEALGVDSPENVRQPVQSYALREWQDPRIAGGDVRWRGLSKEAKRICTQWITKEDLRFFFDVVAKACNDEKFAYRKAFWLAYLENISFCRPVLREDAEYLFRGDPEASKYFRERRPATLTGGARDQHAFIIQIGKHTIVEFSTAGACYVYRSGRCPFRLNRSEYHMGELRNQASAAHRVIHSNSQDYYWQDKFRSWLKSEMGVDPLRSYHLRTNSRSNNGFRAAKSVTTNSRNNEEYRAEKLVRDFGDSHSWTESSDKLVKIGKPAVPALIAALRNDDDTFRNRAIYTLGLLGKSAQAAIPALQEELYHRKDYIRRQAASALKRIKRR